MTASNIHLIQAFIDLHKASEWMQTLSSETPWKQKEIKLFGKNFLEPRLTAWVGSPKAVYSYSGVRLIPHPWTPTLLAIKLLVEAKLQVPFNSVLLNLYRNQKDSMGFHSDDEKELGPNPTIASVSLGQTRRFIIKHRFLKSPPTKTYFLESGSLLIMRGNFQKSWKHGVPKETKPCGPRINLTFRQIF